VAVFYINVYIQGSTGKSPLAVHRDQQGWYAVARLLRDATPGGLGG